MRTIQKRECPRTRAPRRCDRNGITIFEVAIAAVVLGAVVVTAAQLVQWSVAFHQMALRKRCALEAATTVLDRMSAEPWSKITPASAKEVSLPPAVKEFLVDPKMTVAVVEDKEHAADSTRGKRISVELSWAERGGTLSQHVQLTTWVFQPGRGK